MKAHGIPFMHVHVTVRSRCSNRCGLRVLFPTDLFSSQHLRNTRFIRKLPDSHLLLYVCVQQSCNPLCATRCLQVQRSSNQTGLRRCEAEVEFYHKILLKRYTNYIDCAMIL